MHFRVKIHPPAQGDMLGVFLRITRTISQASAEKWYSGIIRKIRSLKQLPERCPLADESETLGFDLRMMLYGRGRQIYRILFTIDGDAVNVLRVRHAAQDWLTAEDF